MKLSKKSKKELTKLESKREEADGEISKLQETHKKRDQDVTRLEGDIKNAERRIKQKEFLIRKKEKDLREVESHYSQYLSVLNKKENTLKELESEITEINFKEKNKRKAITELEQEIEKIGNQITEKEKSVLDLNIEVKSEQSYMKRLQEISKKRHENYSSLSLEESELRNEIKKQTELKKLAESGLSLKRNELESESVICYELEKELDRYVLEMEGISERSRELSDQIQNKVLDKERIQARVSDTKEQIQLFSSELNKLKKEKNYQEISLEELRRVLSLSEAELSNHLSSIKKITHKIEETTNNNKLLDLEVKCNNEKLSQLKKDLRDKNEELNQALLKERSHQEELTRLQANLRNLSVEYDQISPKVIELSEMVSIEVEKIAELKEEISKKSILLDSKKQEKHRLETKSQSFESARESYKKDIKYYNTQLPKIREHIEKMKEEIEACKIESDNLRTEKQEGKNKYLHLEELRNKIKPEHRALVGETERLRAECKRLEKNRSGVEAEISNMTKIIAEKQKEALHLRKKHTIYLLAQEELLAEKEKLTTLKAKYEDHVKELKSNNNTQIRENKALERKVESLESKINTKKDELRSEIAHSDTSYLASVIKKYQGKVFQYSKIIDKNKNKVPHHFREIIEHFMQKLSEHNIYMDMITIETYSDRCLIAVSQVFEDESEIKKLLDTIMKKIGQNVSVDYHRTETNSIIIDFKENIQRHQPRV